MVFIIAIKDSIWDLNLITIS